VGLRTITGAVVSDRVVHRVERVPAWRLTAEALPWRALCGVPVGKTRAGGEFEFDAAVALDPEAWRLAANCAACQAVTERRARGSVG
jgi:hypothetical protein